MPYTRGGRKPWNGPDPFESSFGKKKNHGRKGSPASTSSGSSSQGKERGPMFTAYRNPTIDIETCKKLCPLIAGNDSLVNELVNNLFLDRAFLCPEARDWLEYNWGNFFKMRNCNTLLDIACNIIDKFISAGVDVGKDFVQMARSCNTLMNKSLAQREISLDSGPYGKVKEFVEKLAIVFTEDNNRMKIVHLLSDFFKFIAGYKDVSFGIAADLLNRVFNTDVDKPGSNEGAYDFLIAGNTKNYYPMMNGGILERISYWNNKFLANKKDVTVPNGLNSWVPGTFDVLMKEKSMEPKLVKYGVLVFRREEEDIDMLRQSGISLSDAPTPDKYTAKAISQVGRQVQHHPNMFDTDKAFQTAMDWQNSVQTSAAYQEPESSVSTTSPSVSSSSSLPQRFASSSGDVIMREHAVEAGSDTISVDEFMRQVLQQCPHLAEYRLNNTTEEDVNEYTPYSILNNIRNYSGINELNVQPYTECGELNTFADIVRAVVCYSFPEKQVPKTFLQDLTFISTQNDGYTREVKACFNNLLKYMNPHEHFDNWDIMDEWMKCFYFFMNYTTDCEMSWLLEYVMFPEIQYYIEDIFPVGADGEEEDSGFDFGQFMRTFDDDDVSYWLRKGFKYPEEGVKLYRDFVSDSEVFDPKDTSAARDKFKTKNWRYLSANVLPSFFRDQDTDTVIAVPTFVSINRLQRGMDSEDFDDFVKNGKLELLSNGMWHRMDIEEIENYFDNPNNTTASSSASSSGDVIMREHAVEAGSDTISVDEFMEQVLEQCPHLAEYKLSREIKNGVNKHSPYSILNNIANDRHIKKLNIEPYIECGELNTFADIVRGVVCYSFPEKQVPKTFLQDLAFISTRTDKYTDDMKKRIKPLLKYMNAIRITRFNLSIVCDWMRRFYFFMNYTVDCEISWLLEDVMFPVIQYSVYDVFGESEHIFYFEESEIQYVDRRSRFREFLEKYQRCSGCSVGSFWLRKGFVLEDKRDTHARYYNDSNDGYFDPEDTTGARDEFKTKNWRYQSATVLSSFFKNKETGVVIGVPRMSDFGILQRGQNWRPTKWNDFMKNQRPVLSNGTWHRMDLEEIEDYFDNPNALRVRSRNTTASSSASSISKRTASSSSNAAMEMDSGNNEASSSSSSSVFQSASFAPVKVPDKLTEWHNRGLEFGYFPSKWVEKEMVLELDALMNRIALYRPELRTKIVSQKVKYGTSIAKELEEIANTFEYPEDKPLRTWLDLIRASIYLMFGELLPVDFEDVWKKAVQFQFSEPNQIDLEDLVHKMTFHKYAEKIRGKDIERIETGSELYINHVSDIISWFYNLYVFTHWSDDWKFEDFVNMIFTPTWLHGNSEDYLDNQLRWLQKGYISVHHDGFDSDDSSDEENSSTDDYIDYYDDVMVPREVFDKRWYFPKIEKNPTLVLNKQEYQKLFSKYTNYLDNIVKRNGILPVPQSKETMKNGYSSSSSSSSISKRTASSSSNVAMEVDSGNNQASSSSSSFSLPPLPQPRSPPPEIANTVPNWDFQTWSDEPVGGPRNVSRSEKKTPPKSTSSRKKKDAPRKTNKKQQMAMIEPLSIGEIDSLLCSSAKGILSQMDATVVGKIKTQIIQYFVNDAHMHCVKMKGSAREIFKKKRNFKKIFSNNKPVTIKTLLDLCVSTIAFFFREHPDVTVEDFIDYMSRLTSAENAPANLSGSLQRLTRNKSFNEGCLNLRKITGIGEADYIPQYVDFNMNWFVTSVLRKITSTDTVNVQIKNTENFGFAFGKTLVANFAKQSKNHLRVKYYKTNGAWVDDGLVVSLSSSSASTSGTTSSAVTESNYRQSPSSPKQPPPILPSRAGPRAAPGTPNWEFQTWSDHPVTVLEDAYKPSSGKEKNPPRVTATPEKKKFGSFRKKDTGRTNHNIPEEDRSTPLQRPSQQQSLATQSMSVDNQTSSETLASLQTNEYAQASSSSELFGPGGRRFDDYAVIRYNYPEYSRGDMEHTHGFNRPTTSFSMKKPRGFNGPTNVAFSMRTGRTMKIEGMDHEPTNTSKKKSSQQETQRPQLRRVEFQPPPPNEEFHEKYSTFGGFERFQTPPQMKEDVVDSEMPESIPLSERYYPGNRKSTYYDKRPRGFNGPTNVAFSMRTGRTMEIEEMDHEPTNTSKKKSSQQERQRPQLRRAEFQPPPPNKEFHEKYRTFGGFKKHENI